MATTKDERSEIVEAHINRIATEWAHKIGRPATALLSDERTFDAISLLADAMGDLEEVEDGPKEVESEAA